MSPHDLSILIKQLVLDAGFDLVGIAPVTPGLGIERLDAWLAAGRHGDMTYMARNRDARSDPQSILPGAKSVVMAGLLYYTDPAEAVGHGQAKISRYAWGYSDYHTIIKQKLQQVRKQLNDKYLKLRARPVVDSAPLMERDYAQLVGLGWLGKNTLLLNPRLGSYFFLGALLVDQELEADQPFTSDHCGTCTACLDACPTAAFAGPRDLDPRRCISYLTIEQKRPDAAVAPAFDDWIFGCDVCQDVCPWNQKAIRQQRTGTSDFAPIAGRNPVDLRWLLSMTDHQFLQEFSQTPLARTGRSRVLRNAINVLVYRQDRTLLPEVKRLCDDADESLAAAARQAVEQLESP